MLHEVTDADTAVAVGSGDVPVLATPRLIAWMEAATVRAAAPFTAQGRTTVGTGIRVEHLRPTRVGGRVDVVAEPPATATGRRLTFRVRAVDGSGDLVARGEIDRVVVDRRRFLAESPGPASGH
ncbi:thioesterase family protein [Streptomyces anandii]|uniref:thioesterase family protein n=1 Tax=Streptomyces anandii TaxID=285454 RepID=UPI00167729FA|nr:hotdog domain-containing protein [Streptomyces anandii]GGX77954.1 dihydrolipoamide acyltransferase [Streptomyces anandii JCM 4720]